MRVQKSRSKIRFPAIVAILCVAGVISVSAQAAAGGGFSREAQAILDAIDAAQQYSSISYVGMMEITQGSRVLKKQFAAYARGKDRVFLEFSNPEDRGVRMLRLGSSIWMYFPSERDTVRISGSLMRQGLMGSNLSYEEVAEGESLKDFYSAEILREETLDGQPCKVLKLSSSRTDISYPVRILWVDNTREIPLKIELYARSGILMKTMYIKNVEPISGRLLPTTVEIVDALKKNSKSLFSMDSVRLDIVLTDSMFSMEALTK
ncbi:MAG: outer membrane lipoprotein-sorting protein [Rectinema sp.]